MNKLKLIASILFTSAFFLGACSSSDSSPEKPDPNEDEDPIEVIIKKETVNFKTFSDVKVGFGDGLSQGQEGTFTFPTDIEKVKTINMYIQNPCPDKTCDEWDRFANVYVKNKTTNEWYEIARFITPYWVGTEKLERGWKFDVTDFKSLLTGEVELKIYTETWLAKGRTYSVDFDFVYDETAYPYSAVVPVMQYNKSSIDGIPYGVQTSIDLNKDITLPQNTELAYFRTIITGWGHATPNDSGSRGCAEWCYRTHYIQIDNVNTYEHYLGPIGCATNPINNQSPGNWKPDRAGWCPGMEVPVFVDLIKGDLANRKLHFNYVFEPWQANNPDNKAFYAISTFVVVLSKTPIASPKIN